MKKQTSLLVLFFTILVACTDPNNSQAQGNGSAPNHDSWTRILSKYVDGKGFVDYKGLIGEKAALSAYSDLLSSNAPSESWSENEKIAYWINAYNVFTVKLIVDNYPIESIKDLNPTLSIPTIRSIWTKEWFQIGGEDFSLDQIEHKILRKDFEEPRIHFAVNCASISCPVLRPEAYTAEKLDQQLDEQARIFLNDPSRNVITKEKVELSKIFNWFGGDFKKGQTLIEYIDQFTEVKLNSDTKIRFLKYDWGLNDSSKTN